MGCCSYSRSIRGNIIFRPIVVNITRCGHVELDKHFEDMSKCLEKAENTRKKIADKFKSMIISTGSCVLKHPTFERSVSSFIILIFLEITKDLQQDANILSEFNFKSLLKLESTAPYVSFDQKQLDQLKSAFNIDIAKNPKISEAKTTIIEFIQTLKDFNNFFVQQKESAQTLYEHSQKSLKIIKDEYSGKGTNKISLGTAFDYIHAAELNLKNVASVNDLVSIMTSVLGEILVTIYKVTDNLTKPATIQTWIKIAQQAHKKGITDSKEVVYIYSREEKLKRLQDWEDNFVYIEEQKDQEEELRF